MGTVTISSRTRLRPGAAVEKWCLSLVLASALGLAAAAAGANEVNRGAGDVAIDRLAFLTGCWSSVVGETVIEEIWLPPAGDAMQGLSRTVRAGELRGFEFVRLARRDGAWHYVAQPGGGAATWFELTRLTDDDAVFEDPTHDFPQRIRYRKAGADELHAEISGPGGDGDGAEQTITFVYQRSSCPNAAAAPAP